jgi:hypothetical protein
MNPRLIMALVLVAILLLGPLNTTNAQTQTPNPLYLREMPTEEKVLHDVRGVDPLDAAARQSGAFQQFNQIIYDIALVQHRDRIHLLPDERKIADYYDAAQERAWSRATTAAGQDRARLRKLAAYATDPDFTVALLDHFFSPNFRAFYMQQKALYAARHEQNPNAQPPATEQPAPQRTVPAGDPASSDPGTIAMRRCVASGRSELQCLSEVFRKGMQDMAGGRAGMGSAFGPDLPLSLRMTGRYGDGHLSLSFTEDTLWITCDQISYQADYTVAVRNGRIAVDTKPGREGALLGDQPMQFSYQDGNLVGNGMAQATMSVPMPGQPPAPVQTVRRYISEQEAKNPPYWEQPKRDPDGNPYVDEPMTPSRMHTTKTSSCKLGTELPLGSTGPSHALQGVDKLAGSKTTAQAFGGAPWDQRSAKEKAWPPPGLRLHGTYGGSGGFNLEFHEDSVIVGCGQVMSARNYAIKQNAGQTLVGVDNEGNPIMLALAPDLSLSGSGSIRLNGNAFVGDRGEGKPMFAPASATCTLGMLTPAKN